jgi:D-sedoheptulose 7-phosphate isomerase
MKSHVRASLLEAQKALDALLAEESTLEKIADAGALLAKTLSGEGRVFSCGNGGSMCDAMHFAEELSGRYRLERRALAAIAISDPSHLSCVANDYGYEQVFARYLEAHARLGDCLLAISTSGTSKNVLAAAYTARERGVAIIALTGKTDTPLGRIATVELCTPGGRFADRVQELHIKVIHILIELVERQLFGESYT